MVQADKIKGKKRSKSNKSKKSKAVSEEKSKEELIENKSEEQSDKKVEVEKPEDNLDKSKKKLGKSKSKQTKKNKAEKEIVSEINEPKGKTSLKENDTENVSNKGDVVVSDIKAKKNRSKTKSKSKKKKKLTKEERERLRKEEEQRKLQEELETKRLEREERIKKRKLEKEMFKMKLLSENEEKRRRTIELNETDQLWENRLKDWLEQKKKLMLEKRWQMYLRGGRPDVLSETEINAFLSVNDDGSFEKTETTEEDDTELNENIGEVSIRSTKASKIFTDKINFPDDENKTIDTSTKIFKLSHLHSKNIHKRLPVCQLVLDLIEELKDCMNNWHFLDLSKEQLKNSWITLRRLYDILQIKLDNYSEKLLFNSRLYLEDRFSENLQLTYSSAGNVVEIWANLSKNQRLTTLNFEELKITIELPKHLLNSDCAFRLSRCEYDSMSFRCPTYSPNVIEKCETEERDVDENDVKKSSLNNKFCFTNDDINQFPVLMDLKQFETLPICKSETKTTQRHGPSGTTAIASESKSSIDANNDQIQNVPLEDVDGNQLQQIQNKSPPLSNQESLEDLDPPEILPDVEIEPTDKFGNEIEQTYVEHKLNENIVDLRRYKVLGGMYRFDLCILPQQPIETKNAVIRLVANPIESLKIFNYNIQADSQALEEAINAIRVTVNEGNTPPIIANVQGVEEMSVEDKLTAAHKVLKISMETANAVRLTLKIPNSVFVVETPILARWNGTSWSRTGYFDLEVDDEENNLSFRVNQFGGYALLYDIYSQMPYQSWEILPLGPERCLIIILAAINEIHIEIYKNLACLKRPEFLPHELYEKWLEADELIRRMKSVGINIFPEVDAHLFVTGLEKKKYVENKAYESMSMVASTFAFAHSRWNALVKSTDCIIIRVVENLQGEPVIEDVWGILQSSKIRSSAIQLTEYSANWRDDLLNNCLARADIFHVCRDDLASVDGKKRIELTSYDFQKTVYQLISAIRFLVFV